MCELDFNTAGERHGMCELDFNTAGERHGMCELAFNMAGERHGMCESALRGLNLHLFTAQIDTSLFNRSLHGGTEVIMAVR
jgi:hypothetical protein